MKQASLVDAPHPRRFRPLVYVLGMLAMGVLIGFYSVVSHAVEKGNSLRKHAQAALEREAVCSAFTARESRELCVLTISDQATRQAAARHAAQVRLGTPRAMELTAAAY